MRNFGFFLVHPGDTNRTHRCFHTHLSNVSGDKDTPKRGYRLESPDWLELGAT